MPEVYETIKWPENGCLLSLFKQWDTLNQICWRQGQSKHEDDALGLPCVPGVGNLLLCFLQDVYFFLLKIQRFLLNPNCCYTQIRWGHQNTHASFSLSTLSCFIPCSALCGASCFVTALKAVWARGIIMPIALSGGHHTFRYCQLIK